MHAMASWTPHRADREPHTMTPSPSRRDRQPMVHAGGGARVRGGLMARRRDHVHCSSVALLAACCTSAVRPAPRTFFSFSFLTSCQQAQRGAQLHCHS